MLLSKLNAMSVGPLWVLRRNSGSPAGNVDGNECCPVCGQSWIQSRGQDNTALTVLATPIGDETQRILLNNCLKAAGWGDVTCISLHSTCSGGPGERLKALHALIEAQRPEVVIVFGQMAAQKISPDLKPGQINTYLDTRFVVTLHPEEMIRTPLLKAQVWTDLCLAKFGVLNSSDDPTDEPI